MSQIESDFIDAINADPNNRDLQLIYADWLDGIGDPRAEAWRVLIEEGKRPELREDYWWARFVDSGECNHLSGCLELDGSGGQIYESLKYPKIPGCLQDGYPTFFAAMDAACIAWVRHHRDPDFLKEILTTQDGVIPQ